MRKLCLYGLAGSGKSTAAAAVRAALEERGHQVEVVKLAQPLYRLQGHIYDTAGRSIGQWEHDNELLRILAVQLRRINPVFLVEDFLARVAASPASVVINDDLRDGKVDYPRLAEAGFTFVNITCDDEVRARRLRERGDRTVVPDSNTIWNYDLIRPDWQLDTTALTPAQLHTQLNSLLTPWLADKPR